MLARETRSPQQPLMPLVAVRRSVAGHQRFLILALLAFVLLPAALLVTVSAPAIAYLPLGMSAFGLAWLHIRSVTLERELRRARVRAIDAMDTERLRIQRDLHDSAQQRLVSARIRLGLLKEHLVPDAERRAVDQVGDDVEGALAEIRTVTQDGGPQLLVRNGIADSLRSAAAHAPVDVHIEAHGVERYAPAVERSVYYCCLEALQNVVKHAGSRAGVRIRLVGQHHRLSFSIDDSGVGFDPARVEPGVGLTNLADRVEVMGGHLVVDSHPGLGTRIEADIPAEPLEGGIQA
jgi:signal transduction histidine kinase